VIGYPGKRKNTTLNYIGQVQSINVSTKTLDIQFLKKLTRCSEMIFKYRIRVLASHSAYYNN